MNAKPNRIIAPFLLSTFLLAWAGSALARDIVVEFSTAQLSALNTPPLTASDTITVRNTGTLLIDMDGVTVGMLTIGDNVSAGTVTFLGSHTLTVATNVAFGANTGNRLEMNSGVTTPTLKVGGSFLATGAGSFFPGLGTVEYNGTDQTVTANVGGTGATIQYKNLVLSGSPASGNATKTFAAGLSIQGLLDIREKAKPAGSAATYGSLAQIRYSGSVAQTTTTSEWPTTLNTQITINNPTGVTLDGDKLLGASGAFSDVLVVNPSCTLKDGGKTLTVQGSITNAGSLEGKGKLVLGGASAQVLSGGGNYGNVTLNNLSGASLSSSGTFVRGRLIILAGKLTLPNTGSHTASLLTFGGLDKAAGVYSSGTNPTIFDGSGSLTVTAKPTAVLAATGGAPTITYGASGASITGTVSPPAGSPDFSVFGNGAVDGEIVRVVVHTLPTSITNDAPVTAGAFSASINAAGLSVGSSLQVDFIYLGGNNNLAAATANSITTITVIKRPITIIPANATKVYNKGADPALTYTFSPPDALIGGDYLIGNLSRDAGENVFAYNITQGTLTITNNANPSAAGNYDINFAVGPKLTITQLPVTVTMLSTNKVFGDPDPVLTNTVPLLAGDNFTGQPARASGNNVGSYTINSGNLNAGPNYAVTFVNGNLVINKKQLQITFANSSKTYAESDPTLTNGATVIALNGDPAIKLVGSDKITGSAKRASGELVAGSPYTIDNNNLTAGNNYDLSFVTAQFTINRRPITVTASNPTRKYGQSVSSLVSYSGFKNNSSFPQTTPTTAPTITPPGGGVTSCSLPSATPYAYSIAGDASDPNHSFTYSPSAPISGTYTVQRADLTVQAENKTKVADGNLFDYSQYSANYNFVPGCGDTVANSLAGFLVFTGSAISAVDPGVYEINPSGLTSPTKYNVSPGKGYLSITTTPKKTDVGTDVVWAGGGSLAWMINHANGTAGGNPGWSLLNVTGNIIINATSLNKFRLDLVTMVGNAAGRMPKFDPTRPYSWEIARASVGVANFDPAAFDINYNGANLFSNPVFGGVFAVRLTGKSIFLDFTPVGTDRDPALGTLSPKAVDSTYSVTSLLTDALSSDVDVLYLEVDDTTLTAQQPVTISLKVANLKQPIVGVDAYINFSSAHFIANLTGAGAPQVAPGGGVWTTPVYTLWNVGGDLDTVMAVSLGTLGTSSDGTVATITLTPTKTMTGNSRVVFRVDGTSRVDGNLTVKTLLQPADAALGQILPARVMSPNINIATDTTGPSLDNNTMTATQNQPHGATAINVKGGAQSNRREVVRTGGTGDTASGPVVFTIPSSDSGVGLSGPPVLVLKKSGQTDIVVPCTTPTLKSGDFKYEWVVPAGVDNGTWTADVTATDTIKPTPNTTTKTAAFTLSVNTREVTGIVELEKFAGTNRMVTFKTGDNDGASASSVRQYDLTLNFISGQILSAGAFQDRSSLASKINQSSDPLSTYLRYGDISNLPGMATRILSQQGNLATYVYTLFYGSVSGSLSNLAKSLTTPTRTVDNYIVSRLSSSTVLALAAYNSTPRPAGAPAALTAGLLGDFNAIVAGASIYEPVRFASVPLSPASQALVPPPAGTFSGTLTAAQKIELNRNLLEDAYGDYTAGRLDPATAQRLTQYPGGDDPVLVRGLLQAFDALTVDSSLWPPATSPFGQCLYNETVFLGVTLSSSTLALLNTVPFPSGNDLTLLNQRLLQDGFTGLYVRPPLTPQTAAVVKTFNPASSSSRINFDSGMQQDLNAIINGGSSIYTPARFAHVAGAIQGELAQLLGLSSPSASQLVRLNRLLLELGYNSELSKSVLAPYRLVQVLPVANEVTAKTGWNLRARKDVGFSATLDTVVNFVNNGVPGWTSGSDVYLRGGDMNGDNVVNLGDYNVLRINYNTLNAPGDVDGSGIVDFLDYTVMQTNWSRSGDDDAK